MAEKRYYWLKLKDDFFSDRHIKYIKSQEDGEKMVCVYLELQLKSLKTKGLLEYESILPSCVEEFAFLLDEPVELVEKTIQVLEKLKLVEKLENGSIYMSAVEEIVGQETASAVRKRNQRERYKPQDGNPFDEYG